MLEIVKITYNSIKLRFNLATLGIVIFAVGIVKPISVLAILNCQFVDQMKSEKLL